MYFIAQLIQIMIDSILILIRKPIQSTMEEIILFYFLFSIKMIAIASLYFGLSLHIWGKIIFTKCSQKIISAFHPV